MNNKRKGIVLTENQRLHWLRLLRSENVGAITFRKLIEHYGTAENALRALPELTRKSGKSKSIRVATLAEAENELRLAEKLNVHFVGIGEPDYPPMLKTIEGAPPLLAIKGNAQIFQKASVGIVGSRNASAAGKKLTNQFSNFLGNAGYSIISGLARGIDASAHEASLKTGTVAVMAGGIDHVYPPEHCKLYDQIIHNGGAIVSEMPIGWQPRNVDFPRRNRIVAGLSLGLLVVEAAMRSGSLISARLAAEMGRIVFAIPGSPLDPRAAGTNKLIKDGALLTTHPNDIIEAISPMDPNVVSSQLSFFESCQNALSVDTFIEETIRSNEIIETSPSAYEAVYNALSTTPIDVETLSLHTSIPLKELYLILIELDLSGQLIRHSGGLVSRQIDAVFS